MKKPHKKLRADELRARMLKDSVFRKATVRASHNWFFHFYFWHYVKFKTAPFQKEMLAMTENTEHRTIVITAFRGSAKSTIMNLSYVLWSILGTPQKKFIILVGQTQAQARQHLKNIKDELENNKILRADLWPFHEEDDEWRNSCLVVSSYKAKIMAVSIDQSVRGLRHGPHRPDLIICDDIEDLQSVKTKEGRDKTYQWVKSELMSAGDTGTRTVFIGNLLHEDCLLKKLQREIDAKQLQGIYKEFPLLTEEGVCLWPGKYPTSEAIEAERQRIGSDSAWYREYLLRILADTDRVIHLDWIRYYHEFPRKEDKEIDFRYAVTGIDLAISQSESADFTAMVSAKVYRKEEKALIYILPNPVNEHLTSLETLERAKQVSVAVGGGEKTKLCIEEVGYQGMLIETLDRDGYDAKGMKVKNQDKRARLSMTSHLLQSGHVFFPKHGCEDLINQLVNFGIESHDDLADAFAILLAHILEEGVGSSFGIMWIGGNDDDDRYWRGGGMSGGGRNILNMRF
jgi:phage terminase large subunit-like protein